MVGIIIEIVVIVGLMWFEDELVYKHIRKIDKKARMDLNNWELEHINELLERKKLLESVTETNSNNSSTNL